MKLSKSLKIKTLLGIAWFIIILTNAISEPSNHSQQGNMCNTISTIGLFGILLPIVFVKSVTWLKTPSSNDTSPASSY